jgi:drug/metabolite transporter (DMT)-like permease
MKPNRVLLIVVLLALLGAGLYFYGGTRTPAGQAPLAYLTPQSLTG